MPHQSCDMGKACILVIIGLSSVFAIETWYPARLKQTADGHTSVCTEDYCDTLDVPEPGPGNRFVLISSSKSGERFNYSKGEFSTDDFVSTGNDSSTNVLQVNRKNLHERVKILGFGGAWTGSVTYILNRLSPKLRACFYNSYFSIEDGARYSLIRVPIGGSDFDFDKWVYNLYPQNDTKLSNFTKLDERDVVRNQQIKELKQVTNRKSFKIIGCAWTCPPWMKERGRWNGKLDNQLKQEYHQTWANYHVKWTKLMTHDSIPIWALSTGNEPFFTNFVPNVALTWLPRVQSRWFTSSLLPALQRTGLKDTRIIGYEDVRPESINWLEKMDQEVSFATNYLDYVGIHGYLDSKSDPNILKEIPQRFRLPTLYTEMSFQGGVKLGSWERAENLTTILMESLQHSTAGYIDWNLILNSTGGPTMSSPLDAFIIVNDDFTTLEKQPMFYAMAHFSRFIPPGSIRIDANICGIHSKVVKSLAYVRKDSKIVVILFNTADHSVDLNMEDELKGSAPIELSPRSINTIIYSTKNQQLPPAI